MEVALENDLARVESRLSEAGNLMKVTVMTETGSTSLAEPGQEIHEAVCRALDIGSYEQIEVHFGVEHVLPGDTFEDKGVEDGARLSLSNSAFAGHGVYYNGYSRSESYRGSHIQEEKVTLTVAPSGRFLMVSEKTFQRRKLMQVRRGGSLRTSQCQQIGRCGVGEAGEILLYPEEQRDAALPELRRVREDPPVVRVDESIADARGFLHNSYKSEWHVCKDDVVSPLSLGQAFAAFDVISTFDNELCRFTELPFSFDANMLTQQELNEVTNPQTIEGAQAYQTWIVANAKAVEEMEVARARDMARAQHRRAHLQQPWVGRAWRRVGRRPPLVG